MRTMDPHKILGVSPDATLEEIQRAYRLKATKFHPDHGGEAWAFQQVRAAYEQLLSQLDGSAQPHAQPASSRPPTASPSSQPGARSSEPAPQASPPEATSGPAPTSLDVSAGLRWLWQLGFRQLPLQNETTTFILVNVLDVFMTYILIRFGAIEANPIAQFFLRRWDFSGMIFFKMSLVAFVCVLSQVIAHRNLGKARFVLKIGTLIVGAVVVYGAILFARHYSR